MGSVRLSKWRRAETGVIGKRRHRNYARYFNVLRDPYPDVFFMSDIPEQMGIPEWEFRVVIGRTRIDFDPHNEDENRRNHGYSLESPVERNQFFQETGFREQ